MAISSGSTFRQNAAFAPFFGPAQLEGSAFYVSSSGLDSGRTGLDPSLPLRTIGQALSLASSGDTIFIHSGVYDESITISRSLENIRLVGLGLWGRSEIKPSEGNATVVQNYGDGSRIINLGITTNGVGVGLLNKADDLGVVGCLLSGGTNAVELSEGTAGEVAANVYGSGSSVRIEDCEIFGATHGLKFLATDNGYIQDTTILRSTFHDCPTASLTESGGTASNRFRNLLVLDCAFGPGDSLAGTLPTAWFDLGHNASNTGLVSRCSFAAANTVAGINSVSIRLIWASNFHTDGISTGQPA